MERISTEAGNSVLINADLDIFLNMMDFFELETQASILRMITNCMNLNRDEDFQKVNTLIPALSNFLDIRGTSDKHKEIFSQMCTSFQLICDSPLKFKDPHKDLQSISDVYSQINGYGLMDKCHQFLLTVCNSVKYQPDKNPDDEDATVKIIDENMGKLIKIIAYLCKYSSDHCVIAIKQMKMLDIISILLQYAENHPGAFSFLQETLSLLGAFIPDSRSYQNNDSDFAKNEMNKSQIYAEEEGEENSYKVMLIQSIIPSMLKIFVSSFNQGQKFALLQLIEEIVMMLSGSTLKEYLQPHQFSRFVISVMKSENYTWIEICLRIMLLLAEKKVTLLFTPFINYSPIGYFNNQLVPAQGRNPRLPSHSGRC